MATTKVSELSAKTATAGSEELLINDGGTSKKVTIDNVLHDNSIRAEHYVDGSIATAHIADNAITSAKLGVDVIVAEDIANNAITVAELADNAVTTAKINADAVTVDKLNLISTGSVPSLEAKGTSGVTDGYIQLNCAENSHGIKLKSPPHSAAASYTLTFPNDDGSANQVLTTDGSGVMTWASVGSNSITPGDVNTAALADGAVTTAKLADDAVTADKLANSINTEIAANTAKTTNATHTGEVTGATALTIADNVVDEANLKVSNSPTNGYFLQAQSGNTGGLTWAATSTSIADGSITTAKLAADAVTSAKIADDAIDSEHYTDGSIDTAHIADSQITSAKIADGTIATADIADDAVTAAKLANSINTDIATGVTANTTANAALPKAGGTMTGNLSFGDNNQLRLGASNDLSLYHDGSDSIINEEGTGTLVIMSNGTGINLQKGTSETMAKFVVDDAVELYHNNVKKIETSSTGVDVTGSVLASDGVFGLDSGDKITFTNNTDMRFTVDSNEEMRLEQDGDLHVDGDVIAFSTTISDEALKYDINPVEFALDKINQLKGVSYKYKDNDRESAGLLAQDVEKVMPSAVKTKKVPLVTGDDKEYKTLHYDSMTAILVEAIKELTAKVKKLESK